MNQPKPINNLPDRAYSTAADWEKHVTAVYRNPEQEKAFLESIGDALPLFILQYGEDALQKLIDLGLLPAPLPFILKWTKWGISKARQHFITVTPKKIGK